MAELQASFRDVPDEWLPQHNDECVKFWEAKRAMATIEPSEFEGYYHVRIVRLGFSEGIDTIRPMKRIAIRAWCAEFIDLEQANRWRTKFSLPTKDDDDTVVVDEADEPPTQQGEVVYFVQAGETGPIKIGRSTNLANRIKCIQFGNAVKVYVLGTVSGGARLEAEFHRQFAHDRMRGEWFRKSPELLSFIKEVCTQ